MRARARVLALVVLTLLPLSASQLPELLWTCPMHGDVLADRKGTCPVCAMALEPVRLTAIHSCPVHRVIQQSAPGACPICKRPLVPLTASLTFTCSDRDTPQVDPFTCADGTRARERYTPRAHGDHNPKHGGVFFMASDNWHHLEGTYVASTTFRAGAPGLFRIYVYDDFSRPLPPERIRTVRGRVVLQETFDPSAGRWQEVAVVPLVPAKSGEYLEARVTGVPLPARLTAKLVLRAGQPENRFDFTFDQYSRAPLTAEPTINASPGLLAPSAPERQADANTIRDTPDALLDQLKMDGAEVASLTARGFLSTIYWPALRAKDAALALQARTDFAPSADRRTIETHVKAIVVAAYELDAWGDQGDGEKVREALERFSAAIAALDGVARHRP